MYIKMIYLLVKYKYLYPYFILMGNLTVELM